MTDFKRHLVRVADYHYTAGNWHFKQTISNRWGIFYSDSCVCEPLDTFKEAIAWAKRNWRHIERDG